ncbi:hypothetical protein [Rosistilla oblonga]|uniref:hypothetical protein n=1 Tax=Rosistilla oblonga TaxID=2527990 RepID=UPI003A97AF6D
MTANEIGFTNRLLHETLTFDKTIEKSAEMRFRELGLSNGAIENFSRALQACEPMMLAKIHTGHTTPMVVTCPWKNQAEFLSRNTALQIWLKEHGGEPCDVALFVHEEPGNKST